MDTEPDKYLDKYLDDVIEGDMWKKIHSPEPVLDIMAFFKQKDIDYGPMDVFLKQIESIHEIDAGLLTCKLLVSILMISKYPNDIIGETLGDQEQQIVDKAKEIYDMCINRNTKNIHKKLFTFKIIFEEWKRKDKISQLDMLCEMYYKYTDSENEFRNKKTITDEEILDMHDICLTMDDEAKHDFIAKARELDKEQGEDFLKKVGGMRNKILHQLKMITPGYMKYLKNYKYKHVTYDESIYREVYTKMKYIYWDNIKRDIFELKKCDIFQHIIQDYIDILSEMKISDLDISVLENLKEYDLNEDNLIDACSMLCRTVIDINKQLDSENYDEIYDMLLDKLGLNEKYITEIYKFCFNRLEMIQKIKQNILLKNNTNEIE